MESGAVRLVIFLLKEGAQELSSLASAAVQDILTALPPGILLSHTWCPSFDLPWDVADTLFAKPLLRNCQIASWGFR